jgi:hypothetical protein
VQRLAAAIVLTLTLPGALVRHLDGKLDAAATVPAG